MRYGVNLHLIAIAIAVAVDPGALEQMGRVSTPGVLGFLRPGVEPFEKIVQQLRPPPHAPMCAVVRHPPQEHLGALQVSGPPRLRGMRGNGKSSSERQGESEFPVAGVIDFKIAIAVEVHVTGQSMGVGLGQDVVKFSGAGPCAIKGQGQVEGAGASAGAVQCAAEIDVEIGVQIQVESDIKNDVERTAECEVARTGAVERADAGEIEGQAKSQVKRARASLPEIEGEGEGPGQVEVKDTRKIAVEVGVEGTGAGQGAIEAAVESAGEIEGAGEGAGEHAGADGSQVDGGRGWQLERMIHLAQLTSNLLLALRAGADQAERLVRARAPHRDALSRRDEIAGLSLRQQAVKGPMAVTPREPGAKSLGVLGPHTRNGLAGLPWQVVACRPNDPVGDIRPARAPRR